MRPLATAVVCAALLLALAGCLGSSHPKRPLGGGKTSAPTTDPALARAHKLFKNCKVKGTVSLHNGTFYLELRDGSRVDLPKRIETAINAEIAHSPRRCPPITASME